MDLTALRHNLDVARTLSKDQKLFAVVKADAYGHGAVPVAKALVDADGFAVVTVQEALELRQAGIDKPVLVLQGPQSAGEIGEFTEHELWPVIHCEQQLCWIDASPADKPLSAWLKIDSGMGRLGFLPHTLDKVHGKHRNVNWVGVMTHFSSADELDNTATQKQIDCFLKACDQFSLPKSLANSAGLLAWPDSAAEWARPGIMLYGCDPVAGGCTNGASLRPAMRVSAPLISRKTYPAGAAIGYAGKFVCPEQMDVGYVAIGYGDGLPRVLDPSASVLIGAHRCCILGRVSMDSIAVDLRGTDGVDVGSEVVLWGPEHPVEHMAKAAGTISYEILTGIKGTRHYIESGKAL